MGAEMGVVKQSVLPITQAQPMVEQSFDQSFDGQPSI
jgi:hypothetical protein